MLTTIDVTETGIVIKKASEGLLLMYNIYVSMRAWL